MLKGKRMIRQNKEPGVMYLSAVEFSNDHSRVVVLVGHSCGDYAEVGHCTHWKNGVMGGMWRKISQVVAG
jgi:hypothetical protein